MKRNMRLTIIAATGGSAGNTACPSPAHLMLLVVGQPQTIHQAIGIAS